MIARDLPVSPLRHQQSTTTDSVNTNDQSLHPLPFHSSSIQNIILLPNSHYQFDFPGYFPENKHSNHINDISDASLTDIQSLGSAPSLISSDSCSTGPISPFEAIGFTSLQSSSIWIEPDDSSVLEHYSASKFRDFYSHSPDEEMAILQTESLDSAQHKSQSYPRSSSRTFLSSLQPDQSQFCHPRRRRRIVSAERLPQVSHARSVHSSSSPSIVDESGKCSKHLPTPTDTPTHESFFARPDRSFNSGVSDSESRMSAEIPSRPILRVQNSVEEDDIPAFSNSGRHSVSSHEQAPTTPRTSYGDDAMDRKARYLVTDGKALSNDGPVNDSSVESTYWLNDYSQNGNESDSVYRPTIPNLDRTMSDVYQDELYNPLSTQRPSISISMAPTDPVSLSPFRNSVCEKLQAADAARSSALDEPTSTPISPFRINSPLVAPNNPLHVPSQSYANTHGDKAPMRTMSKPREEAQTISPKEAMLDYSADLSDSKHPLFSESEQVEKECKRRLQQQQQQQQQQQNHHNSEDHPIQESIYDMASDTTRPMPWELKRETSHIPFDSTPPDAVFGKSSCGPTVLENAGNISSSTHPSQAQRQNELQTGAPARNQIFDMASNINRPPPWEMKRQIPHAAFPSASLDAPFCQGAESSKTVAGASAAYQALKQQQQQQNFTPQFNATNVAGGSEVMPEFPARLNSMETSMSDAAPDSSQGSTQELRKPSTSSLADRGTYTCTYHGCTLRFATASKLQRHEREGHRAQQHLQNPGYQQQQQSQEKHLTRSDGSTSPSRNSQTGPHRCARINPTTGKPCETVFSRPYDLTRHEDTIHNARKQKVRCALCIEEKTFSRNDALTRHMRVVHPEVDFPGKHRKRGSVGSE